MSQTFSTLRRTNVRDAIYEDAENNFSSLRSNFSGTSFPENAVEGQWCYRTDEGKMYRKEGNSWVERGNVTKSNLDECIRFEDLNISSTITLPSSSNT